MPFILLVEDNDDDAFFTMRALREAVPTKPVQRVKDGQEALDFLFGAGDFAGRNLQQIPRFILLDLNLPRVSGLQVLQRLRADERTRAIPVVVMSSSMEESDVRSAYRDHANSYVQKPIELHEYSEVVHAVGEYWSRFNRSLFR